MLQVRNSIHLNLDRNRDLLFDLFRGTTGPLRNNLHPGIRHVGIGLDRQVVKRDHSPNEEQQRRTQYDEAVVEGEINDGTNHCDSAEFWNSSALATSSCPGAIPETTSCMLFGNMSPPTTSVRRN